MPKIPLVVLAVVLVTLAITNPSMDDFSRYAQRQAQELLAPRAGDERIGRILSDIGARVAGELARHTTTRDDYIFVSVYTIDFNPDRDDEQWRFLGIWGNFIELERPRSLRERR